MIGWWFSSRHKTFLGQACSFCLCCWDPFGFSSFTQKNPSEANFKVLILIVNRKKDPPWFFNWFAWRKGTRLSPNRPRPGNLREERAAGEVLPRSEGQGWGPKGAEPGLQRHRDGARGARRGPQRADGSHRPERPAAEGVLPGQTGRRPHRWEINHHKWRVAVIYSSNPNPCQSVLFSQG